MKGRYARPGGFILQRKDALSFVFKVILLGLAILMIIFGLVTDLLNGENQELAFTSPAGKTMPEEGYVTPVYDGMTYMTVKVESQGANVEVHLYSANYRGGKVINDTDDNIVIRDEFLAAGEKSERIGRNVELSDFTAVNAQYWVRVVEPDGSIPSAEEYKITIRAYSFDMTLIALGLLFYAIFIFLGIFEYVASISRTLKQGVPMSAEVAEGADLEALLEPSAATGIAAAPMAMAPEEAPPPEPAPTSYDTLYGAPAPAAAPAPAPMPEPMSPYAPPPPPVVPPPAPVAPPAYQAPPPPIAAPPAAAPAPAVAPPPAAAPAPAPAAAPAPAPASSEPMSKVRCPSCKSIVPVYTTDRPTPIECPTCGKKGMIR
jgi:hypothetical protein